MKRVVLTAVLTAALVFAIFAGVHYSSGRAAVTGPLTVGFIYDGDESTPYTYNFSLAERVLEDEYPDEVRILTRSNVLDSEMEEPVQDLITEGCRILFTNSYSEKYIALARKNPEVEFCQVSYLEKADETAPENYHTFKGAAYEGRYVSGVVAGLKLEEMKNRHLLPEGEVRLGYIAAYPTAEVISGFTAFLLGVRSVVPEATLQVRYTNTWSNFALEKDCTKELIDKGCVVISQHTDTFGPAIACEEAGARKVLFVGYNQSMMDVAPTTALISTRINWSPYIRAAVSAMLEDQPIERAVRGRVNGRDICAGFDRDWVQVVDLNTYIAAEGTEQKMNETIAALKKGSLEVFRGDYTGVNPFDAADTVDLGTAFKENDKYSSPSFHYYLKDVVQVEGQEE